MFISLVVLFPALSTLTHIDASLSQIISNPEELIKSYNRFGGISSAFQTLHYDAYANIMATVDYTTKNGFSLGYQLLSALLFFVPRSLWSSKPTSTGELIGDYLMNDYGLNFNNLSNCIISEAYIDFGLFGIILFAFILAYSFKFFLSWLKSNDFAKQITAFYFAVHLIFLLRGDLTNGFAYFIGVFLGIYFIPKLLERIIYFILKKAK
ncbi:O-antigen polysaccharide polymerase Wzy [Flavivirga jejuensis]|uniref:O-antigen polysaccharide polymerase Wzy n=1 Tax=Flavivirga jejuensis TaxID=870487 RepID=A0ABT8WQ89_9FLAO|nr:O-antigen polysaccharide polymerase Wzy [Flavivirga jejuensis]MDO5975337.1 O-antigen polysaccharide polymerase Wzy [Flavivirga jejuensis]